MGDFSAFAKFGVTLLCVQNMQNLRIWDLRRGVFQALIVGLLFWRFSLGPPYAKSQKMGDFSAFAKFGVTLLCVHFWSRRLRQNVGRCLHFTRILIKA